MFPIKFELQNFYPMGEIFALDKYIIRCLLLKYWLTFFFIFLYLARLKAHQILSRLVKICLYFKWRHLIIYNYYQIPTWTLKLWQKNYKNISRYYHTSFEDYLVNFFYPRSKILEMWWFLESSLGDSCKFLLLVNFHPLRFQISWLDNKYIIRCLLLKYWLIFLLVFSVFDSPEGSSNTFETQ